MKKAIVNFYSKGRENYEYGTKRLLESIQKVEFDCDTFIFNNSIPACKYGECKHHKEAPYQFKSFAIQYVREQGYKQICWLDSSIVLNKNPIHHFDLASETGVVVYENKKYIEGFGNLTQDKWTNDTCLNILGCSIDEAKTANQLDAGMMIFDFTTDIGNKVFDDYFFYCRIPEALKDDNITMRPEFKAHRHDQSILTHIVKVKYNLFPLNYGTWCYWEERDSYNPTFMKVGM